MEAQHYDEPPLKAWSFSRLVEVYEKCPHRAELQFVHKIEQGTDEKRDEALSRGKQRHDEAEQYVRGTIEELPKGLDKFASEFNRRRELFAAHPERLVIEEQWAFTQDWQPTEWYAVDTWCRMIIDIGEWLDDEKTAIHIEDYKTGKKEGNEVKHSQQGQLFNIGTFMRYSTLQVAKVNMQYLDHGKRSLTKTYTREQAMKFLPGWERRAKAMTEATYFKPKPNRINCKYCPFGPNKGNGTCEYGVEV